MGELFTTLEEMVDRVQQAVIAQRRLWLFAEQIQSSDWPVLDLVGG